MSAGGVVYRVRDEQVEIIICGRENYSRTSVIWQLPKGTPDSGETREETALREVNEESGLEIEIDDYIGNIEYWFALPNSGVRCHKTVYYYLMEPTGGDISLHDHEFEYVKWSTVNEAVKALTYENEVGIVKDALSMVSKKARAG